MVFAYNYPYLRGASTINQHQMTVIRLDSFVENYRFCKVRDPVISITVLGWGWSDEKEQKYILYEEPPE